MTLGGRTDLIGHKAPGPMTGFGLSARVAGTGIAVGALLASVLAVVSFRGMTMFGLPVVAHVAGLLAGYGVAVMVVLMSRVPWLERGVGADRLARWHGAGGRIFLVLMLVHAVAATLAWSGAQHEDPVTALAEVMGFPWLIAATIGTVLFVVIAVVSIRIARQRMRYERWHLIHLLTYVAIALSFGHELAGPDLAGLPAVQVAWSLLFTVAFGLLLRYRVAEPLLRLWRHQLRVDAVIDEGNGVSSIVVRGRYLHDLQAEAGQFFRWRFLGRGTWTAAHPFSLSAPPDDRFMRLTVKAIGDGTTAIRRLRPGTRVLAEGPYGAMTDRNRAGSGVLLVAGGVGITPMRALFETIGTDGGSLTLLYRASSPAEVLFRDELEAIARRRGAQLAILTGSSSDPANEISPRALLRIVPDIPLRDVYVCASPRFANAVKEAVRMVGVPPARLHTEEFSF